ncbi:MAG: hypothetical protein RB292_05180 [Patescibacteria group bacterium]|jgi:hypothetical protein|nr:hypothetical protein [Patescibacteria group bacterium]
MQRIHPGHEVLSLFGIPSAVKALDRQFTTRNIVVSLASAFFIVLLASLLLNLFTPAPAVFSVSAETPLVEEPAAYQPGSYITNQISRGYLGDYR